MGACPAQLLVERMRSIRHVNPAFSLLDNAAQPSRKRLDIVSRSHKRLVEFSLVFCRGLQVSHSCIVDLSQQPRRRFVDVSLMSCSEAPRRRYLVDVSTSFGHLVVVQMQAQAVHIVLTDAHAWYLLHSMQLLYYLIKNNIRKASQFLMYFRLYQRQ